AKPESQDEIVGYHLEQACYYREEFGEDRELAARAAARLEAAGRRGVGRCDLPAAVNLLTRAIALLPEGSRAHAELLPELGSALIDAGDFAQAERVLTEAR